MKIMLFISIAILSYIWILYYLGLCFILRFVSSTQPQKKQYLSVTILLTVHNEEELIEKRIDNLLSQDYPNDLFEVLVASDGSTDRTDEIIASIGSLNSKVKLYKSTGGGKSAAQNSAICCATGDIVVLTDADTLFLKNTLREIAGSFSDEKVGCVGGKLILNQKPGAVAQSQGLYWKMEMALRKMESRLGSLHTCSGQVMAFRREIFKPFPAKYGDDCIIPLDIILQGYKVVHNDKAIAIDTFPSSIKGELQARVRMTLRNITCTLSKYPLLNPHKYPLVSIAILSHKLLRWLTPYLMILALIANLFLIGQSDIYLLIAIMQGLFYFFGLVGFICELANLRPPIASSIFSFILANVGFFLGVFKAILGKNVTEYRNKGTCNGS